MARPPITPLFAEDCLEGVNCDIEGAAGIYQPDISIS
jgi:hypothetical protein